MFTYNPARRITAYEALHHPWFDTLDKSRYYNPDQYPCLFEETNHENLFVNPLLVVLGVLDETLGEPEVDLALSRLHGVRTVDDVVAHIAAKVTTNGSRFALHRLGGSHHLTGNGNNVVALPDHGNDGRRAHEAGEAGIELLTLVLGIVLLQQLHRRNHHLQTNELEALLLEAGNDLADMSALDTIGLDSKEGSFLCPS